ncbi:unnamed protein product [Lampetra planeri]
MGGGRSLQSATTQNKTEQSDAARHGLQTRDNWKKRTFDHHPREHPSCTDAMPVPSKIGAARGDAIIATPPVAFTGEGRAHVKTRGKFSRCV